MSSAAVLVRKLSPSTLANMRSNARLKGGFALSSRLHIRLFSGVIRICCRECLIKWIISDEVAIASLLFNRLWIQLCALYAPIMLHRANV